MENSWKGASELSGLRLVIIGGYAIVLFLLQFLAYSLYPNITTISWSFLLFMNLLITCWFPLSGGILYIATLIAALLVVSDTQILLFASLGVYAVGADWISRRWYWGTVCLFATIVPIQIYRSDSPGPEAIEICVGLLAAAVIGLGVSAMNQRVEVSEQAAREAEFIVHRDIASNLHQTVARDLAGIIITSDGILTTTMDSQLQKKIQQIEDSAKDSLATIRQLISRGSLDNDRSIPQIAEVCTTMLSGSGITLASEIPRDIDLDLSERQRQLLRLALHESTTNAMKHAPRNSTVQLLLEMLPGGEAALTVTSTLPDDDVHRPNLQGGFGLAYLQFRLNENGGHMKVGPFGQRWLFSVRIPRDATGAPDKVPL